MGFFSWKTADTQESIRNIYSYEGAKTVYLLQPGRKKNIREDGYEGYGVFGGIDAYVWLAEMNHPKETVQEWKKKWPNPRDYEEYVRMIGIRMDCSDYYRDKETGKKYGCAMHFKHPDIQAFFHYDEPLKDYGGKSANQVREEGRWERRPFLELMMPEGTEFKPLKFSYDPKAKYEDLPASESDETQGYFGLPDKELFKNLVEEVLYNIKDDVLHGDLTVLEEILMKCPLDVLIGSLDEDEQEIYDGMDDPRLEEVQSESEDKAPAA